MIFGFLPGLGLATSVIAVYIFWRRYGLVDKTVKVAEWRKKVAEIASNHMQVNGVLAGVSITLIVLLSGLRLGGPQGGSPPAFEELTVSLFTIAFFGYAGSSVLFSVTPERENNNHQFSLFALASSLYYLSAVLSFTALVPLVGLMAYQHLRPVVAVLVAGVVVGGYLAVAIPFSDLLLIRKRFLFLLGPLSAALFAATVHESLAKVMGFDTIATFISRVLLVCGLLVSFIFSICMLSFFYEKLLHPGISLVVFVIVTTACLYVAAATLLLVGVS